MQRGTVKDDLSNKEWTEWLQELPKYRGKLNQHPSSEVGQGNAMEQAAGIAYAAATQERFLNGIAGELDWTGGGRQQSSKQAWAQVWGVFEKLGLRPTRSSAGAEASASTRTSASASPATRAKAAEPPLELPPSAASERCPPPSATQMGKEKRLTYVRTYVRACLRTYVIDFLFSNIRRTYDERDDEPDTMI